MAGGGNQPLSQREFDTWRQVADQSHEETNRKLDRILDHVESQHDLNRVTEGRLSKLEVGSGKQKRVGWTSMVIALITGVATVLASLFGG